MAFVKELLKLSCTMLNTIDPWDLGLFPEIRLHSSRRLCICRLGCFLEPNQPDLISVYVVLILLLQGHGSLTFRCQSSRRKGTVTFWHDHPTTVKWINFGLTLYYLKIVGTVALRRKFFFLLRIKGISGIFFCLIAKVVFLTDAAKLRSIDIS